MTVSIETQIASVAREVALRRACYPKWVANGRLKASEAIKEQTAMEAVLETLQAVKAGFEAAQRGEGPPSGVETVMRSFAGEIAETMLKKE